MTGAPWLPGEAPPCDRKRHAPATLRNRDAIAAVLTEELPPDGLVLEVASGSGEHATYFAAKFPALEWQPSDSDLVALASIAAWSEEAGLANLRLPLMLDATTTEWSFINADAILCVNMVHISPWAATLGLMAGARRLLGKGKPLILYGPFIEDGVSTAPSNMEFNASLCARDPEWGLRNVREVSAAAAKQGLQLHRRVTMPANNLMLVYRPADATSFGGA